MPKMNKAFTLEITVDQFVRECSPIELHELDMLMQSKWVQNRMKPVEHIANWRTDVVSNVKPCSKCPEGECEKCPRFEQ